MDHIVAWDFGIHSQSITGCKKSHGISTGSGREFEQVIPQVTDRGNLYVYETLNHFDAYLRGLKRG